MLSSVHCKPNYSQDHGFVTLTISKHSNHFDLITVARVLITHQQQFKQQLVPWSDSDLQPSTNLRFTEDQQHGRGKTQHRRAQQQERKCRIWSCVVVDAQHSLYSDARCTVESSFICLVPHVEYKNLSKSWKNVLQSDLACARFQESTSGKNLLKSTQEGQCRRSSVGEGKERGFVVLGLASKKNISKHIFLHC